MTSQSTSQPLSRVAVPANDHFSDNGRRGRYGVAYLRSLAAHAGVGFTENSPDEDIDAVDVTLKFGRASAEVQVKCSSGFKVGPGSATVPLEPAWVKKWTESYHPVYLVLVKVPADFGRWIESQTSSTKHGTVAFGKRFDAVLHTDAIQFTASDRLSTESLYDWRDEVYEYHRNGGGS